MKVPHRVIQGQGRLHCRPPASGMRDVSFRLATFVHGSGRTGRSRNATSHLAQPTVTGIPPPAERRPRRHDHPHSASRPPAATGLVAARRSCGPGNGHHHPGRSTQAQGSAGAEFQAAGLRRTSRDAAPVSSWPTVRPSDTPLRHPRGATRPARRRSLRDAVRTDHTRRAPADQVRTPISTRCARGTPWSTRV